MNSKAYHDCVPWSNKILRGGWMLFAFLFFRPFAGPLFRRWRILILKIWGAELGWHCAINASASIYQPWKMHLADHVAIGAHVRFYNCDIISIGKKTAISQNAFLCTASHNITDPEKPLITKPIIIGEHAWIAADAFVGMGVTIGDGAVVGARGCAFKDIEPWTVVGGNPASFIKKRIIKDE